MQTTSAKLNQTALQDYLRANLEERRARNNAFSIRAFAKKLGISHSALSEIMNGKRTVGEKLGARLLNALTLDPKTWAALTTDTSAGAPSPPRAHLQLQADQYQVIAEWFHFAILSLMETAGFRSDSKWIARRLRIRETDVKSAIDRLIRLNLIARSKGKLKLSGLALSSPDGAVNAALRATHRRYTELAQRSLEEDEIHERDFSGMTVAIDPGKLPEAKKRLRAFRDEFSSFLESGEKTEVYQLCLQLFPLSEEV